MSVIAGPTATGRVQHGAPVTTCHVRVAVPSLLPPGGDLPPVTALTGAMEQLYAAMSSLRDARTSLGQTQVRANHLRSEAAQDQRDEALKRAEEAANKGGVIDWISGDIGLAGVVGLCTFNYALVAADIAAHKLDVVDDVKVDVVDVGALATGRVDVLAADILLRKTDLAPAEARNILERCGLPKDAPGISDEDVKPIARKVLVANMLVVSATASVLSCGTLAGATVALAGIAISAAGTAVAEHQLADKFLGKGSSRWVGLGMQVFGAAVAASGGLVPGKALPANVKAVAGVIQGAQCSVQGADTIVRSAHAYQAARANIDAEEAKRLLTELERFVDRVIEGVKESTESHTRAEGTLRSVIETQLQTQLTITQGTRA